MKPELILWPETLAVCRLGPAVPIPDWALAGSFFSVTRTPMELSIVCPEARLPTPSAELKVERGFRAFQVVGPPLDFTLTGLLAALLAPLARAAIPVFVLSTFDTDFILVRTAHAERAAEALGQVASVRRSGA